MKDRETPLKLVRLWDKIAPGSYDVLDELKEANGKEGLSWPDYCELPISAAFTYLVGQHGATAQEAAIGAAELTACWLWRQNKVIYAFDKDFGDMLASQAEDMGDTDKLPMELLLHLPYPCIYIKANILEGFDGFWAWIEFDVNTRRAEFRVQWVAEDMSHSIPYVLHLLPGGTLKDCILDTAKESLQHINADIKPTGAEMTEELKKEAELLLRPMQLILYLISERADIEEVAPLTVKRERKEIQLIRDKASEVTEFSVGVRIGGAIRKYKKAPQSKSNGTGSAKRPHSRRGHWHHYWTGPMSGERKLVLQWTAPTFIHPDGQGNDDVIIFPIK